MFRQSLFIFAILVASATTNTVYPLKKIVKLALSVSKSTYLPFDGTRYIQDGRIICRTQGNITPWYNSKYEKICCQVGGWMAKSYENGGTELILFTHKQQKLAVFGFRGTEGVSITDWMKNFKLDLVEANVGGRKFRIHEGFRDRYRDISSWFDAEYLAIAQDYTIILTGHSLGGALATIAAVYAAGKHDRRPDAVITFASPKVGEQNFHDYYNEMVGCDRTLRVTSRGDIVPKTPIDTSFIHTCEQALQVDASSGWLDRMNIVKTHSMYRGYEDGINRKYPNAGEINFGCDKLF